MARRNFDEVMIVNPGPNPNRQWGPGNHAGERTMRFSYYGQPEHLYGYSGYGDPQELGYYGHPGVYGYDVPGQVGYAGYGGYDGYGGYAGYDGYAGYGGYGGCGEPETAGYFAEETPLSYYGEDPQAHMNGYAGDPQGYGDPQVYGNSYGSPYGDDVQGEEFADDMQGYGQGYDSGDVQGYDHYGACGEQEMSGYVRDLPPTFNAGCPMPTNTGMGAAESLEGYIRPNDVSPSCREFTPVSDSASALPETLRPLW